jgi:ATP phosphoribosyltransferase
MNPKQKSSESTSTKTKIALPTGRLLSLSRRILRESFGLNYKKRVLSYQYNHPDFGSLIIKLLKVQDIPQAVSKLGFHIGVTYGEWQLETEFKGIVAGSIPGYQTSIVVLSPKSWNQGWKPSPKETLRVATNFPNLAQKYLKKRGVRYELVKVHGSEEAYPPDVVDIAICCLETGQTAGYNELRVAEIIHKCGVELVVTNKDVLKEVYPIVQHIFSVI